MKRKPEPTKREAAIMVATILAKVIIWILRRLLKSSKDRREGGRQWG